jgi:hypothetical protein
MDREEIIAALTELAAELQRRGTSADMYVVGGAAIALAFDERRATRDLVWGYCRSATLRIRSSSAADGVTLPLA